MEADEIYSLAAAVFGDFEEIDHTQKTGGTRECRCDIGQPDGLDGIHFDLAFVHGVTVADLHVRTGPDSYAAGDFAGTNSGAETFSEYHLKRFIISAA